MLDVKTARGIEVFLPSDGKAEANACFRRVLVADDDPATRRLVAKVLDVAGYLPQGVPDGIAALEAIRIDPPHFLITDWEMPGMSGPDLCRALRRCRLSQYVYVIMLTVNREIRHVVEAVAAGADSFICKPFHAGELLARVQSGLHVLELEHRLQVLAHSDPLTGLANRRSFFEQFERQWAQACRSGDPLSVVMIDVDRFKRVNDCFGHVAGDAALRAIASALQERSRRGDLVCRIGGEEFAVLLPHTPLRGASTWAEAARHAVRNLQFAVAEEPVPLSISVGVAERCPQQTAADQLIQAADAALNRAKATGRDRVVEAPGPERQFISALPSASRAGPRCPLRTS